MKLLQNIDALKNVLLTVIDKIAISILLSSTIKNSSQLGIPYLILQCTKNDKR